ncbi:sodium- and chloride-dependent GABA transporter 1 [Hydra vulgaris]|uniref:Transporter n=1 Tax=Hydra vulgaris TaxID=6087 RepID=T2M2E9_HYDVU|nr:sodium- and chloride-dependent GABA transporter 1 [Hydra vulgaris]XP_047131418.1 sodium- and chloride-dependent GABA transporter 1 [Hydra vulgaris]
MRNSLESVLQPLDEKSPRPDDKQERETWGNKIEFILTCVGYCVGLGNVWRFPYLVFNNGGGAFLIPYFIMLFVCGMPLFLMELAMGQYFSNGPVSTWNIICPVAKGVGFAMIAVAFLCTVYYNVVIAWVIYYIYASIGRVVPWKYCSNKWNTENCYDGTNKSKLDFKQNCSTFELNITNSLINTKPLLNAATTLAASKSLQMNETNLNSTVCSNISFYYSSPSQEFWERKVLNISGSLSDSGTIRYDLLVCLIIAWTLVFFCLIKGIKSTGKVVYITATLPYVLLSVLMIRGAFLEGAGTGIAYYLKPNFSILGKINAWVEAATQIFYSLGIGFGSLIAFGSYNKFNNNVVRDAVTLCLVDAFTCIFSGMVVFAVLGHMSYKSNIHISKVATSGPGLIFVVYPEGISQMPISQFWGFLFFFTILSIGVDTQFAMLEAVVSGLIDEYKFLKKRKALVTLVLCIGACLFGVSMVMQNGMYVFNIFNLQSGGISLLFLALVEVLALGYGYGADKFEKNIEEMIGYKPYPWWKWCWKFISPIVIFCILLSSILQWTGITYGDYKYPLYGEIIGWFLALASMIWIPTVAIYKLYMCEGTLLQRFKKVCKPKVDHKFVLDLKLFESNNNFDE